MGWDALGGEVSTRQQLRARAAAEVEQRRRKWSGLPTTSSPSKVSLGGDKAGEDEWRNCFAPVTLRSPPVSFSDSTAQTGVSHQDLHLGPSV